MITFFVCCWNICLSVLLPGQFRLPELCQLSLWNRGSLLPKFPCYLSCPKKQEAWFEVLRTLSVTPKCHFEVSWKVLGHSSVQQGQYCKRFSWLSLGQVAKWTRPLLLKILSQKITFNTGMFNVTKIMKVSKNRN